MVMWVVLEWSSYHVSFGSMTPPLIVGEGIYLGGMLVAPSLLNLGFLWCHLVWHDMKVA